MKKSTPQVEKIEDTKKLASLEKNLGLNFKSKDLLKNAFIHRSYLNEVKSFRGQSNERLEFLGDAILSAIVSKFLFEKLKGHTEGQLTQLRAALVRTETLSKVANQLSLGKYLFMAKGEEDSGGRKNSSILANTFEALVGAIFLDLGSRTAEKFVTKYILEKWQTLTKEAVFDNKSKLQEVLQRKYHVSPVYKLLKSWGPDHKREFEIGVFLEEKILAKGMGKNKQSAAQEAAGSALAKLRSQKGLSDRIF